MAKHKQLELEHAVLQERVGEMEHEDASRAERGRAAAAGLSTTSSAEMYAKLANSSDWSARQMGAIEGASGLLVAPRGPGSRMALRADCLAQLGVPELAELFSFVWVTAATANASPSGVASAETECAVERAVVSAQRYVRSAVRKREEESAHAQPPPPPPPSGDAGPSARSPVMLAVGRVLREATKALHQGVSDIAGAASSGIPAPIPKVQLRSSREPGSGHAADDELVGQAGIATAVDMLSAEIQARRHFVVWPASPGSLTCPGARRPPCRRLRRQ